MSVTALGDAKKSRFATSRMLHESVRNNGRQKQRISSAEPSKKWGSVNRNVWRGWKGDGCAD
jgi:hypothetical protein